MKKIAEADALATMSDILAEVEAGETVVLTRDGKPTIELRRAEPSETRTQAQAIEAIRRLRTQVKPDSLTIREMIDEGRRF